MLPTPTPTRDGRAEDGAARQDRACVLASSPVAYHEIAVEAVGVQPGGLPKSCKGLWIACAHRHWSGWVEIWHLEALARGKDPGRRIKPADGAGSPPI